MDLSMASCNAEKASMKSTEYRKVIKPLLERRRRARINSCLDELKALILETAQNENTDASKLEKADILELTVQHLRSLRQSSRSWSTAKPVLKTMDVDKFRAGFAECAHEVSSYISGLNVVETDTKSRLLTHLAHCINRIPMSQAPPTCCPSQRMDTIHCHLTTPTPPPSPVSPLRSTTDYVVPVSPISPTPSGDCNPYLPHGGDVYLWPEHVNRSFVDTQNLTCDLYDRSKSRQAPYVHPKSAPCVGFEHYGSKPWRPW